LSLARRYPELRTPRRLPFRLRSLDTITVPHPTQRPAQSQQGLRAAFAKHIAEFGDDDDMVVLVQGADRAKMELALEHLAARSL